MSVITFDEIHARVAAFHRQEAAERAPVACAYRALSALREVMPRMSDAERAEVVAEVAAMLDDMSDAEWVGDRRRALGE